MSGCAGAIARRKKAVRFVPGMAAVCLAAVPAVAHHANSAFDRTRTITLSGTVVRWQFINPHVGIWIDVIDESGNSQEWSGEFQSIQDLYRLFGWNKDTFKPGDPVTIVGNPDRREGRYSIWTELVILTDGTRVEVRNNP